MRLQPILNNLGTNAAKFTDEGRITIAAHADRDTVVFVVRDSGCGIPAAQHESIFDAFEQGTTEPGRKASGIGLGLAIVRQLTDVLDGSVSVASQAGAGSTFTIRLPLVAPTVRGGDAGDAAVEAMRRVG